MLCPAMNSDMYSNAFTRRHLTTLRDELHCVVVGTEDGSRSSAGEGTHEHEPCFS
jgi:phosphopantothenoylcysteine synthetase/decarboxylase